MLIDTSALIWYALAPGRLSRRAATVMRQKSNAYSYVSLWEMAIKSGLGKLQLLGPDGLPTSAGQFLLQMVRELHLSALQPEFEDFADIETLPLHHCDPFDRLLVVQARRSNLPIVSADRCFEAYGVERVW